MAIKQEIWDIAKRNIGILIVGLVFIVLYFSKCNPGNVKGTTRIDTVTNTVYVPQPVVVNPPYVPQQEGKTTYITLPNSAKGVIPASTVEALIAQVKDLSARIEALGKEYYAVKHYADSIQLKDTSGTRVGVVSLKQTVSENTLKETQSSYQLSFPHTTTTITKTLYPPKKNQLYAGIGVGSLANIAAIQQVSIDFLLKNKVDNIIGVSGTYDFPHNSPGVQVHYYKLITFKRPP